MFKTLLMYLKGKDQPVPDMLEVPPGDVEPIMKNVEKGEPFTGKDKAGNSFYVNPREYRFIKVQDPTPPAHPRSGGSSREERTAEPQRKIKKG